MDIAITKMSSKGQVVIPSEMRAGIKEGDKIIVIKSRGQIIMKNANEFNKKVLEDLEFARETEEEYRKFLRGEFKHMSKEKFLKELEKW